MGETIALVLEDAQKIHLWVQSGNDMRAKKTVIRSTTLFLFLLLCWNGRGSPVMGTASWN